MAFYVATPQFVQLHMGLDARPRIVPREEDNNISTTIF